MLRCGSEHASLAQFRIGFTCKIMCTNVGMCNERMRARDILDPFTEGKPPARRRKAGGVST